MNDMTTTLTLGQLAKALAAAQAEMRPAVKDATNPHFKSNYADLEAVNEAARVLAKHGIAVMCVPNGWNENRIVLRAMLVHSSGEYIEGRLEVPVSQPNNPQALGSAMTYGRRYAVSALANIATADDDGNAAAEGDQQSQPKKAQPRAAQPKGSQQTDPESADKGSAGPSVAERCRAKADEIVHAINAAHSFADINVALSREGLSDIQQGEWELMANGALAFLKAKSPDDFARVVQAYEDAQAKDLAA